MLEKLMKTVGPNLAGRHSRSSLSACQQKPRGSENHRKGYPNSSQIHPKSRKNPPGRGLRNHLKIVARFLGKFTKMTSQMDPQRAPEAPPLGKKGFYNGGRVQDPSRTSKMKPKRVDFRWKLNHNWWNFDPKGISIESERFKNLTISSASICEHLLVSTSICSYFLVSVGICQDLLPSASIS